MNDIADIEMLPLLKTARAVLWGIDNTELWGIDSTDYPRWFRYQGQLYSLNLMARSNIPGWDFETRTSESNGTVFAAVLDEKTVRVGRIPHIADDN